MLTTLIFIAGLLHFGILIASALVPQVLDWKSSLARLDPLLRQVIWVHGAFIVLVIIGFGVLGVLFAGELVSGSPLARGVAGFIALFWAARLAVQFFVFDATPHLKTWFLTLGYHGLTVVFAYIAVVCTLAALWPKFLAPNTAGGTHWPDAASQSTETNSMKTMLATVAILIAAAASAAEPDDAASGKTSPSELARGRAAALTMGVKMFRLNLDFHGDEEKPFYRLTLSVPEVEPVENNPFYQRVQISEEQAAKLIDYLAHEKFFDNAFDRRDLARRPALASPGYTLSVAADGVELCEDLGWGEKLLPRLDDLRKQLDGEAAKSMDFLIGRLGGLR